MATKLHFIDPKPGILHDIVVLFVSVQCYVIVGSLRGFSHVLSDHFQEEESIWTAAAVVEVLMQFPL